MVVPLLGQNLYNLIVLEQLEQLHLELFEFVHCALIALNAVSTQ